MAESSAGDVMDPVREGREKSPNAVEKARRAQIGLSKPAPVIQYV